MKGRAHPHLAFEINSSPMFLFHNLPAIERPRPVPSPCGLVVNPGWNTFAIMSGPIPSPVSEMERVCFAVFTSSNVDSPFPTNRLCRVDQYVQENSIEHLFIACVGGKRAQVHLRT